MDNIWIWIIVGIVALAAIVWYQRRQPRAHGSYDDKDVRSSGSIGGGKVRAYDDEDVRSSGTIGGAVRDEDEGAYDDPEHRSGGSIGG